MRATESPKQTAEEAKLLQEIWYGSRPKNKIRPMKTKPFMPELANPHDIETAADIVAEIRKDKKPYALKVAKELDNRATFGDRVLLDDAATCLRDDCKYIKDIADRIESANERMQYEVCHVISSLVSDAILLRHSDERNGKPYKLFGWPLTITYGKFAVELYRAARIKRKFWLQYLQETHSDPDGIEKQMRRFFRDKRCN